MKSVSVIIPVKNEAGNISPLIDEILAAAEHFPLCEIIVVNDGSTDDTARIVSERTATDPRIKLVTHTRSGGQSAAVHSGVLVAVGEICATLDGDGQNPPSELPKLVAPLLGAQTGRLGLMAGQRVKRQDTLSKRLASKFANGIRSRVLRDGTRDTGCGLKAFRRDAFLMLPFFNHMHRYLPALFTKDGWEVGHVDVSHRERGSGTSKYNNFQRGLVGVYDLIGVSWMIRRRKTVNRPADLLCRD